MASLGGSGLPWYGGRRLPCSTVPTENEYVESFYGKLRDEVLDREVFYTLLEVQVLTERYRQTYNRIRPHSSLGYRPPSPETIQPPVLAPELVGLT